MTMRTIMRWLKHLVTDPVETTRWLIALWLDRSPRTCWAKLAGWAARGGSWRELRENMYTQLCSAETGVYCGKCVKTGRLNWFAFGMGERNEERLDAYLDALTKMPDAPTQRDIEPLKQQVLARVKGE